MRRPIGFRKPPPAKHGWSMIDLQMAQVSPRSPTSPRRISVRGRDTGFPEGFCGNRNTSLPHPNANLSPDACITEDDIAITRALARHRMSFIAQKEKQHRVNRGMALNAIDESESQQQHSSSSSGVRGFLPGSSRDKTFSTVSRLALSSLHGAEFQRHLRRPSSSNGTSASDDSMASSMGGDSMLSESPSEISSSGGEMGMRSPGRYSGMDNPLLSKAVTADPREQTRDPRDGRGLRRRKSFFLHRLIHR